MGRMPTSKVSDTTEDKEQRQLAVAFDSSSAGQVAMVIYEWKDVDYLGADTPDNDVGGVYRPVRLTGPVSENAS